MRELLFVLYLLHLPVYMYIKLHVCTYTILYIDIYECREEDLPTERPTDPKRSSSSRILCNIRYFCCCWSLLCHSVVIVVVLLWCLLPSTYNTTFNDAAFGLANKRPTITYYIVCVRVFMCWLSLVRLSRGSLFEGSLQFSISLAHTKTVVLSSSSDSSSFRPCSLATISLHFPKCTSTSKSYSTSFQICTLSRSFTLSFCGALCFSCWRLLHAEHHYKGGQSWFEQNRTEHDSFASLGNCIAWEHLVLFHRFFFSTAFSAPLLLLIF